MPALPKQTSAPDLLIPNESKAHLQAERERIIEAMRREHPGMRLTDIDEVAYRKDRNTPEEILNRGGFIPVSKKIRIATAIAMDSPLNEGLVDFSLVPEVAALFAAHKGKRDYYIYASPVDKGYLMPGQWRQVAAPAMPVKEFLVARKVLSNEGGIVELGPPTVVAGEIPHKLASDEAFQRFMTATHLDVPKDIGLGDENYPPEYSIRDTSVSQRFFPPRSR